MQYKAKNMMRLLKIKSNFTFQLLILIQSLDALSDGRVEKCHVKIESCQVSVFNSIDELVKLEHKD